MVDILFERVVWLPMVMGLPARVDLMPPLLMPVERVTDPSSPLRSLLVTQWRTEIQNKMSALQIVKQIQAGSPLRTMRIVRLVTEVVRVAQEPTKERQAMRLRRGLALVWYECKPRRGTMKRRVR
jgi:hypothetical protein